MKGNLCILPLKQCLQWVTRLFLLKTSEEFVKDKVVPKILSLGWPNLWCHSNHLFILFTWKAKELRLWDEAEAEVCLKKFCE